MSESNPTDPVPQDDSQPNHQPTETGTEPDKSKPAEADWRSKYETVLAQSRKWEERAKSNKDKAARLDEIEAAAQTENQKLTTRAEKAETQAAQAIAAAVRAEVRAAAAGWADPADAPRYIDDLTAYVNADGDIDSAAIAADVAKVLQARPHLAATSQSAARTGPAPDAGQGAGGGSLADQIRAAESSGDVRTALALKAQQLLANR